MDIVDSPDDGAELHAEWGYRATRGTRGAAFPFRLTESVDSSHVMSFMAGGYESVSVPEWKSMIEAFGEVVHEFLLFQSEPHWSHSVNCCRILSANQACGMHIKC